MKKILFLFLLMQQIAICQIVVAEEISKKTLDADFFIGIDALGSDYYIKNNVFFKNDGSQIYEYKNLELGKPTKIDIENPMKIVLFYENFNSVISLDNQLNETQKIYFSENEIPINASAVGISSRNSLWIFNVLENKIGLFDYLKKDYKSISTIISNKLKMYKSDFNYFYFINDLNELYSCDIFGKIKLLVTVANLQEFEIINDKKIIIKRNDGLQLLDLTNNQTLELKIPEKTIKNFYYKNQFLSIFTNQEITNYKINLE